MNRCNYVTIPLVVTKKLGRDNDLKNVNESLNRSMVGSLMYFSSTRPDILFVASLLSGFMHCSTYTDLRATIRAAKTQKNT